MQSGTSSSYHEGGNSSRRNCERDGFETFSVQSRQSRTSTRVTSPISTLVPRGFECVAHPIFLLGIEEEAPDEATTHRLGRPRRRARRRERDSRHAARPPITSTTTSACVLTASSPAWTEAGADGGAAAASTCTGGAPSRVQSTDSAPVQSRGAIASTAGKASAREVDIICPICLGKLDQQPVTLTSCLHTFCHTCILGWYDHTATVAYRRGHLASIAPGDRAGVESNRNATGTRGHGRALVPYRCPLCQVPGPFFLTVEPASEPGSAGIVRSKLKFRLLGARTVFGGGGEANGVAEVDPGTEHRHQSMGKGTGYPSMPELRAAVRTQLALAAALSASRGEEDGDARTFGSQSSSVNTQSIEHNSGPIERSSGAGHDGCSGADREETSGRGHREGHEDCDAGGFHRSGRQAKRRRGVSLSDGGVLDHCDRADEDVLSRRRLSSLPSQGGLSCNRGATTPTWGNVHALRRDQGSTSNIHSVGGGSRSLIGVFGDGLPWKPGVTSAEEALKDIEDMLAKEREKLRR